MKPPSVATAETWPPDYVAVYAWRQKQITAMRADPVLMAGALEYYSTRPVEFICHWCETYDPRNAGRERPAYMPFILFKRQAEFVEFLLSCLKDEESGLVEKCRDIGATWVAAGFSVWLWRFWPGSSVGWGSRKEQLVDRLGDADSIFEKMRIIIRRLPRDFWPAGFKPNDHMPHMKILNPANGATITGEAGDNIGRGGRKLLYFKDESAHYERPEKIEAALADNTRVQIDISSVRGTGNVFHRRREAGQEWAPDVELEEGRTRVFIFDWTQHPDKTQEWYDRRRKRAEEEGLLHLFAQEVDRDYAAAVEGVIIPAEWVNSAIDAHIRLGFAESGGWVGGLDVADSGGDKNAFAARHGVVLRALDEWGARDTGVTARKAIANCERRASIALQYDCIGVGAGIKAEINRLQDEPGYTFPSGATFAAWNAGAAVLHPDRRIEPDDPDTPLNKDFYHNLKAQGWWQLRRRFEKTHRAVTEGVGFDPDELISLPNDLPNLATLRKELSQPTATRSATMKMMIEKTPEGTKSPNLADAVMMAYWPAEKPEAFKWHVA